MAFTDADLDALYDAGASVPVTRFSDADLDALYDSGGVDLGNEAKAIRNSAVTGVLDLSNAAESGVIGLDLIRKATGLPSNTELADKAARYFGILGDEKAKTVGGKVGEKLAYYAPSALLPGSLPARVASVVLPGVSGGLAKAAGASPGVQTAVEVASLFTPLAARGASSMLRGTAQDLERSALGVLRSDVRKARKYAPKSATGESPLTASIEQARNQGIFKGATDPVSVLEKNQGYIDDAADKVSTIIKDADSARVAANDTIVPSFSNAREFVKNAAPGTRERLANQLDNFEKEFADTWDGSIEYAQGVKKQLNKKGYSGLTDSKDLDKAIARDLKETVEGAAEKFGGVGVGAEVKATNQAMGRNLTLKDVLQKNVDDLEKGSNGLVLALRRMAVSPIGGSAAGIGASVLTGNPLPAILGTAAAGLTTRTGKILSAKAARKGASILDVLGGQGAKTSRAVGGAAFSAESLRPSKVTDMTLAGRPSLAEAEIIPSLAETVKTSPSYKYSPSTSASEVLADSDFISHYYDTTKQLPELQNILEEVAGGRPIKSGAKKLEAAADKIARKVSGGKPQYTEKDIGDLIRGQITANSSDEALQILRKLEETGAVEGGVENYLFTPNSWGYQGINANLRTKGGALAEVQIHTPESIAIQNAIHPIYEKFRQLGPKVPKEILLKAFDESRTAAATALLKAKGKLGGGPDVKYPTVELPIEKLKLSEDVPQWKAGADKKGIVKPLGGRFERRGVGPVQVWERKTGDLEVISGRHRFAKAVESKEKTLPSQIHKETEGFTAQDARRLDAELNIMKGHGEIPDYVKYFQESDLTEVEAAAKGLIGNEKGRQGYAIGKKASPDVMALFKGGEIDAKQAATIADLAPNDPDLQRVGSRAALEGQTPEQIENVLRIFKRKAEGGPRPDGEQGDLFGGSDAAINKAVEMSRLAKEEEAAITKQIRAGMGSSNDPVTAKEVFGIAVGDAKGNKTKLAELRKERARWAEFSKHPDLIKNLESKIDRAVTPTKKLASMGAGLTAASVFEGQRSRMEVEKEIDADPYLSTLYEVESGRNPKAKNPKSSATGAFQFINSTARAMGLKDPTDLAASLEAVRRFTNEHKKQFGDDPATLYAAHFLGAPTLKKVFDGLPLSSKQKEHVNELKEKALPRFQRIYSKVKSRNA